MHSSAPTSRRSLRLALAALVLAAATPAAAADAALEFTWGPVRSEWLALRSLEVLVDGVPAKVAMPEKPYDPQKAEVTTRLPLASGAHQLEVVATFDGDSSVFTYVDGVRFTMRGVQELDAKPGDAVAVRAHVVARDGVTVKWEERYGLVLDATVRQGAVPVPAPAPVAEAAPPAAP